MTETFDIAGYTRISVDDELDRDRSGYTFEQREDYQAMRRGLMSHQYDILIVKDFSRFSWRNSRGLVELEDLRDAGVRIISIGDNIDFPNDDEWLKIQFQFLINKCQEEEEQIVIENHHQTIIGYRTFATTRALREKRSTSNYRGARSTTTCTPAFSSAGTAELPCSP